jgi:hypothetical protein
MVIVGDAVIANHVRRGRHLEAAVPELACESIFCSVMESPQITGRSPGRRSRQAGAGSG